jgi:hypothetical protein
MQHHIANSDTCLNNLEHGESDMEEPKLLGFPKIKEKSINNPFITKTKPETTLPPQLHHPIADLKGPTIGITTAPASTSAAKTSIKCATPLTSTMLSNTWIETTTPGSNTLLQPLSNTSITIAKESEQSTIAINNHNSGHQSLAPNNNTTLENPVGPAQEQQDTPNRDTSTATCFTTVTPNVVILIGDTICINISMKPGLLYTSTPDTKGMDTPAAICRNCNTMEMDSRGDNHTVIYNRRAGTAISSKHIHHNASKTP